jgi:hypothetical protein
MAAKLTSSGEKNVNQKDFSDRPSSETKVSKYLTDIKELPPVSQEDEPRNKPEEKSSMSQIQGRQTESLKKGLPTATNETLDGEQRKRPFSAKDVILGVINFISFVFLVIILMKFPSKAQELRKLKIEELKNEATVSPELGKINVYKTKVDELDSLFLDEVGVVDFVDEVEKLKSEGGAFDKVIFASQKVVEDRTGNYGIPVIIELRGSWKAINTTMEAIDKLPFLFRPANITAEPAKEEGVLIFKYGGFLYVNDRLDKN